MILKDKRLADESMHNAHLQIKLLGEKEALAAEIMRQKELEIRDLGVELEQVLEEREFLHNQLEHLKVEVEEVRCSGNGKKLREMEEVIAVCREQIVNFDQINFMSQCVMERLERQVNE